MSAGTPAAPAKEPWTSAAELKGGGEASALGWLKESAQYRIQVFTQKGEHFGAL